MAILSKTHQLEQQSIYNYIYTATKSKWCYHSLIEESIKKRHIEEKMENSFTLPASSFSHACAMYWERDSLGWMVGEVGGESKRIIWLLCRPKSKLSPGHLGLRLSPVAPVPSWISGLNATLSLSLPSDPLLLNFSSLPWSQLPVLSRCAVTLSQHHEPRFWPSSVDFFSRPDATVPEKSEPGHPKASSAQPLTQTQKKFI